MTCDGRGNTVSGVSYNADNYYGELRVGQSFGNIKECKKSLDEKYEVRIGGIRRGDGKNLIYSNKNNRVAIIERHTSINLSDNNREEINYGALHDLTTNTTYLTEMTEVRPAMNTRGSIRIAPEYGRSFGREGYYNKIETATYVARDLNSNGVIDADEIEYKDKHRDFGAW